MISPIRPQDLKLSIPEEAIKVINDLITKNWDGITGSFVTVKMSDVKTEFRSSLGAYDERWLNFESVYKQSGWDVTYHKPSIGDNAFDPYYEFKPI